MNKENSADKSIISPHEVTIVVCYFTEAV